MDVSSQVQDFTALSDGCLYQYEECWLTLDLDLVSLLSFETFRPEKPTLGHISILKKWNFDVEIFSSKNWKISTLITKNQNFDIFWPYLDLKSGILTIFSSKNWKISTLITKNQNFDIFWPYLDLKSGILTIFSSKNWKISTLITKNQTFDIFWP